MTISEGLFRLEDRLEQISIFDLDDNLPLFKIDTAKPIRLISLFSGYDSQKLAFDYLGIDVEHYRVIELDKNAIKSLNEIHNTNFPPLDITKIKGEDLGILETEKYTYILTYSFPCQSLSLAGKRGGMEKGSGTTSSLLWEVERLLNETCNLPNILIMENVKQVFKDKSWSEWVNFLERKGYSNYAEILNAKDYGVPQNRERCFMVSILGRYNYKFPKGFGLRYKLKDLLERNVDESYYLSYKMCNYIFSKNEKICQIDRDIACTITTREGNGKADISNYISVKVLGGIGKKKSNSGTQWYQQDRIYDNKISMTVTKTFQPNYLVEENKQLRIRKLTPKECFKLMGVKPKDYEKVTISKSQKYSQAGNSIVTTCLMAIYSQLFNGIDYKKKIDELVEELVEK